MLNLIRRLMTFSKIENLMDGKVIFRKFLQNFPSSPIYITADWTNKCYVIVIIGSIEIENNPLIGVFKDGNTTLGYTTSGTLKVNSNSGNVCEFIPIIANNVLAIQLGAWPESDNPLVSVIEYDIV